MGKDSNFDVLYRGERLGRTYADVFMLEMERPVSLVQRIDYINTAVKVEKVADHFDDDQLGLPF